MKKNRILAIRPEGIVIPSIHGSMVRAFQGLGAEVVEIAAAECFAHLRWHCRDYLAVFCIDLAPAPQFLSGLPELQTGLKIPWAVWFVDDPEGYRFPQSCAPEWTLAFCWDREIVNQLNESPRIGRTVVHLPLAADPQLFFPENGQREPADAGGVFAGSTAHRNDLLASVPGKTPGFSEEVDLLWKVYRRDFGQSLHGLAWERLAGKVGLGPKIIQADPLARLEVLALVHFAGMRKRLEVVKRVIGDTGRVYGDEGWRAVVRDLYRGTIRYGEELRKVYGESRFILDVRQPQGRTGITQRPFDAGACGRAVLAEWSPELDDLFEPRSLFIFRNPEEAEEERNRCLRDPAAAGKKGEVLRKCILAAHTYGHRAKRIWEAIQKF